jgi:hypothetical protein
MASPAVTPELIVPGSLVDEYGDVIAARDAFAPTERLYRKLSEQLKNLVAGEDDNAEFLVRGERYTLRISARSMESKVDVPAVRKRLGAATFLLVAQVTKKALEGWLLRPEIEALCISTHTGPRSFDAVPIAKP